MRTSRLWTSHKRNTLHHIIHSNLKNITMHYSLYRLCSFVRSCKCTVLLSMCYVVHNHIYIQYVFPCLSVSNETMAENQKACSPQIRFRFLSALCSSWFFYWKSTRKKALLLKQFFENNNSYASGAEFASVFFSPIRQNWTHTHNATESEWYPFSQTNL